MNRQYAYLILLLAAHYLVGCKVAELPPDKQCIAPTGIKTTRMANNVFRYLLSPETVADNVVSATYTVEASGKTVSIESNTDVASQAYVTLPGPGNYIVTAKYVTDCGEVSSVNTNLPISQSACVPAEKIWVAPSVSDPLQFQLSLVGGQGSSTNLQWKVKNGYDDYFTVSTTGAGLYRVALSSADLYSVTLTYQTLCGETHTLNTLLVADLMKPIAGGSFMMGNDKPGWVIAAPVHKVTVSDFSIAKFEVTVAQFRLFIESTSYKTDAEKTGKVNFSTIQRTNQVSNLNWQFNALGNKVSKEEFNRPVIYVSWNDADSFGKWLSLLTEKPYRLPREAEWEYAAGNGTIHTPYAWGSFRLDSLSARVTNSYDESAAKFFNEKINVNGYNDGFPTLAPIEPFRTNWLGLYHMSGNVSEWCSDWYSDDYYKISPINDPIGPTEGSEKVIKGNSWVHPYGGNVFGGYRTWPNVASNFYGFRIVRNQ